MKKIIVTMEFESLESLTPAQKAILTDLVDDAQYAIAHAVDIEETEWSLEVKE